MLVMALIVNIYNEPLLNTGRLGANLPIDQRTLLAVRWKVIYILKAIQSCAKSVQRLVK